MAKVNLTLKPIPEQLRIIKDFLDRRAQHKTQGDVSIGQVVNRFKHKKLSSNRAKASHFDKLIKMIKKDTPQ